MTEASAETIVSPSSAGPARGSSPSPGRNASGATMLEGDAEEVPRKSRRCCAKEESGGLMGDVLVYIEVAGRRCQGCSPGRGRSPTRRAVRWWRSSQGRTRRRGCPPQTSCSTPRIRHCPRISPRRPGGGRRRDRERAVRTRRVREHDLWTRPRRQRGYGGRHAVRRLVQGGRDRGLHGPLDERGLRREVRRSGRTRHCPPCSRSNRQYCTTSRAAGPG